MKKTSYSKELACYAQKVAVSAGSLTVIRCVIVIIAIMHSRIVSGLHVLVLSTSCLHGVSWSRHVTRQNSQCLFVSTSTVQRSFWSCCYIKRGWGYRKYKEAQTKARHASRSRCAAENATMQPSTNITTTASRKAAFGLMTQFDSKKAKCCVGGGAQNHMEHSKFLARYTVSHRQIKLWVLHVSCRCRCPTPNCSLFHHHRFLRPRSLPRHCGPGQQP